MSAPEDVSAHLDTHEFTVDAAQNESSTIQNSTTIRNRMKSRISNYLFTNRKLSDDSHTKVTTPDNDAVDKSSSSGTNRTNSDYLDTGFTLIGYTFVLQIILHMMTFLLNSLSYRYLDTASLGLVNVRLGLFYSTLIFTSREAFRRACLSRGGELIVNNSRKSIELSSLSNPNMPTIDSLNEDFVVVSQPTENCKDQNQKDGHSTSVHWLQSKEHFTGILNLAWLVLPTGFIMIALLSLVWIFILPSPSGLMMNESNSEFKLSSVIIQYRYFFCIMIYALSGLFELATEPLWLLCQLTHEVRVRIFIEAFANTARSIGIMLAILIVPSQYAIYSLSVPQLLHGSTLFISYLLYFQYGISRSTSTNELQLKGITGVSSLRDILPNYFRYPIDQPGLQLVKNFFGQCILKQLLTEGERYLISAFHLISFSDQGIYDLVNNLGSLAARLLFLPLEESCHFIFSQCIQRDISPNKQDKKLLMDACRMLKTALRISSLIAWIGVTFAQANSRLLLMIYAGHRLADNHVAVNLLQLYSVYVLLLAWNGSTEALLNSAMSTNEVSRHNQRLIIFSVIFLCANWFLVPIFNVYGFVLANGINMITRILYSCYYITKFLTRIDEPNNTEKQINQNSSNDDHHECSSSGCNKSLTYELSSSKCEVEIFSDISLFSLMLPSLNQAYILFISLLCTLISQHFFCCSNGVFWMVFHSSITCGFLLITLIIIYYEEVDILQLIQHRLPLLLRHRKSQ
ncbi:Protein RFT1 [Schistosoma japonicum]|uniref:Protein RFT1 homolog n=1 Tax=Schistosoma japonicum TaxID=6182 RepID=A0A4Z2DJW9_SCHJA|nr:Protein RFT1 [Schistosoma japonicum]